MCTLEYHECWAAGHLMGCFKQATTGYALEGLRKFLLEFGHKIWRTGELHSTKSSVVLLHLLVSIVIHLSQQLDVCAHKMEGTQPSVGTFWWSSEFVCNIFHARLNYLWKARCCLMKKIPERSIGYIFLGLLGLRSLLLPVVTAEKIKRWHCISCISALFFNFIFNFNPPIASFSSPSFCLYNFRVKGENWYYITFNGGKSHINRVKDLL